MFNTLGKGIAIFIICIVILIALLCGFIITIVYLYQQRQLTYFKKIEDLKEEYGQALFQSQLEIQEKTFQNITRDIHKNIGNKLTLIKVLLNTLHGQTLQEIRIRVSESVALLSAGMTDLRDLSRSMSSEVLTNNGIIKGLEFEVEQLKKSNLYSINFIVTGNPIFLSGYHELVLFRIAQEAISNIIKHAQANKILIELNYNLNTINLSIKDNGTGFNQSKFHNGNGLLNIQKRVKLLHGRLQLRNENGANLSIQIPVNVNTENSPEKKNVNTKTTL